MKVFVPGLVRSDLAYIGRVIGTVRNWREYAGSIKRLNAIEVEGRTRVTGKEAKVAPSLPPVLEWWLDNYSLITDARRRRYPIMMVTYDSVVSDPEAVVGGVMRWLGGGNVALGVDAVRPESQTQQGGEPDVDAETASAFDELYEHIHLRKPMSPQFFASMEMTHRRLIGRIQAAMAVLRHGRGGPPQRIGSPDWRESVGTGPYDEG